MKLEGFNFRKALWAGFYATTAMTLMMYAWPLVGLPPMDIMAALGGIFPFGLSPYVLGSLLHLSTGIFLGLIYALFFDVLIPGPSWLRGALFSLLPWVFAITLLGPGLQFASEVINGRKAVAANPCSVSNPCAVRPANPCAVKPSNPCAIKTSHPQGVSANPCSVTNPCAVGPTSSSALSPKMMSLIVHLLFGVVLGMTYKSRYERHGRYA